MSDVRNQKSDAVQAGFMQSCGCSEKIKSVVVGAGLKCPPEQSAERKDFMSVMKPELLSFAVTNYKIQLSCGRAWKPAPTSLSRFIIVFAAEKLCGLLVVLKFSCTASDF